jgi:hypothetical protein
VSTKTTQASHGFRKPLTAVGGMRALLERARQLEAATARLAEALPAELVSGWQLARLDADAVVIIATSAALATRLRYARAALLQAAQRQLGTKPKTLSVKLAAPARAPRPVEKAELTPAAAAHLRQAVSGIEDERLRRALSKLARRAKG